MDLAGRHTEVCCDLRERGLGQPARRALHGMQGRQEPGALAGERRDERVDVGHCFQFTMSRKRFISSSFMKTVCSGPG
jgi:hypothetical protein